MPKLRHENTPRLFPTRPAHVQGAVGVGFTSKEYNLEETFATHSSESILWYDWSESWIWLCHKIAAIRQQVMKDGYSVVDFPPGSEGFYYYDQTMRIGTMQIISRPREQKGHDHDDKE